MWSIKIFVTLVFILTSKELELFYGPPEKAFIEERPFQAAILKNFNYHCAAAIISERCVLTACSCVLDSAQPNLTTKDNDLYTIVTSEMFIDSDKMYTEDVSNVFYKKGCNTSNNENDVAIICSDGYLYGIPVTIAKGRARKDVRSVVSGWGLSIGEENDVHTELRKANMRVISLDECHRRYAGTGRSIPDSAICAEASNDIRGFCGGDVGGPLTYGNTIIGVAVTSFGCEPSKYPGIFTNVSMFSNFIENVISNYEGEAVDDNNYDDDFL